MCDLSDGFLCSHDFSDSNFVPSGTSQFRCSSMLLSCLVKKENLFMKAWHFVQKLLILTKIKFRCWRVVETLWPLPAIFLNRRICFVCTQGGLLGPYCWNLNVFVRAFCTAEAFGIYSVRILTVFRGFRWSACLNTDKNSSSRCSLPKFARHVLSDTQERKSTSWIE